MVKNLHNDEVMNQLKDFSVPWEDSQDAVWQRMETTLDAPPKSAIRSNTTKVVRMNSMSLIRSVAAVAIILIATVLFMRFFERNIESAYGEQLTHQLPDGSVIELNSGSSLSYHPLWWRFDRNLSFEGEGFFMVQKGKMFTVKSSLADTQVLGTSFSIFSRDNDYRVTCHTGQVQVNAHVEDVSAILSPNQTAQLEPDGKFKLIVNDILPDPVPWKSKTFEYTATPLREAFEEIQRQYDVEIIYPEELDYYYTGDIHTDRDIISTLDLVCKAFQITFEQKSEGEYQIIENPDKQN
ncbi:MAG: FecR family protein [Bacteroidales bacterium]|nr:FecR family protein [Bacteroidales bacterium]